MSRATDITLLLICIQGSIGFVNAMGIFDTNYQATPSNEGVNYTVQDLETYRASASSTGPSITEELGILAHWTWEAFVIGIKIIFTVAFVYPTLVTTFNIPTALSVFLQLGIYFVYAMWFAQWKSGKGWKFYE